MSRLSGHADIVQDAATKLAGDTTAMSSIAGGFSSADAATITTAIAAAAAALTDLRDALGGNEEPSAMQPGTGADGSDLYESTVIRNDTGDLFYTQVFIDIDGLVSSGADNDVIGEDLAANAHFGQYTVAEMGTLIGARVTCLETPAGGEVDLDIYSNASGTIAEDADGTTGTALVDRAGDWAAGDVRAFAALPAANEYLYITQGTASTPTAGTYTAGKFLLEFWGHTV